MNEITRRNLKAAVAAAVIAASAHAQVTNRPNIVAIMADDLGYGDIGVYGAPIRTPHIDGLAKDGLRLTDYYSAAPNCSPARAGLLTGRTPARTGIYDYIDPGSPMHLPPGEITTAELLRSIGYDTCHAGKWHLSSWEREPEAPLESPTPGDQGFDHWFAVDNNAVPSHHNPTNFIRNGEPVGELEGYSCHLVADEAIRWLEDWPSKDEPFFLNVWFNEPHKKIASPPEIVESYDGVSARDAEYFANVTNMDAAIGRILATLDELGVTENTLVIFTSDNGSWRDGSSGGLRAKKSSLYEGGIRVPGVIRWPSVVAPGRVSGVPVGAVDVFPTLAAITGAELPSDRVIDGESVLPLLKGDDFDRTKPLFWLFYKSDPMCVVRKGDFCLTANPSEIYRSDSHPFDQTDQQYLKDSEMVEYELYNLSEDRSQTNDIAGENPEKVRELSAIMNELHAEVLKEGPIWEGLWEE
jgi:arylsulfatase A